MSRVRTTAIRWFLTAMSIAWSSQVSYPVLGEEYYPSHETVVAMVDRGIAFLEGNQEPSTGSFANGGPILVAFATFKVRDDPSHPLVVRGINSALRVARGLSNPGDEKVVYNASIAAMLLSTVDVQLYRSECLALRDFFVRVQRNHGGYGYLGGANALTGDTSQVQYAVLALWTLDQAGIDVPVNVIENAANWLRATQDPSGRWGYQGIVASGTGLVPQDLPVSHSLTAAGLGATLIAGDFLGFYRTRRALNDDPDVPKAFRRVIESKEGERRKTVSMKREELEPTIQRGVRWNSEHEYVRFDGRSWHYYYRYSEERVESFLEISRGRQEKSPAWYNRGVEELKSLQSADGGWGIRDRLLSHCTSEIATAFAVLYLIRSTQSSFGKLNEGVVAGGQGLPKNTENIIQIDGKIVDKSAVSTIDEMLKMMEEEGAENKFDATLVSDRLRLDQDPQRRKEQLVRLSRLLASSDYKARRSAAKLLGRGDDLEAVPSLIFALSDPDPVVPKVAENSLRVLSRQSGTPTFPADNTNPNASQRQSAIEKWKAWFLSVRPDYVFVDRG